jgi:glycosyltransferase involved in cell wall biosynthesis
MTRAATGQNSTAVNPLISVILPAFNEEGNIGAVYKALRVALRDEQSVEIIFVDDGSTDGTAAAVEALRGEMAPVRLIRFSRNFGHQAALMAGLEGARGTAVITLDCDLQHPPELLPRMIARWRSGAKVVQMVRVQTKDAGFFKVVSSKLFYKLLNLLSETHVLAHAADYQLLDRQVVDALLQFQDRHPFLRGLVAWLGFPSVSLEYEAPARHAGTSGYSLRKMVRLSIQAVTALSSRPLRFSFYVGVIASLFCLAYALYALAIFLSGASVAGWTSIVIAVTFLGGIQLFSIGILGEYLARIYEQTRGIPRSVVLYADNDIPAVPQRSAASGSASAAGVVNSTT